MKYQKLILIGIILIGTFFRFYGINWDNGHYLHPDERFMYMTLNDLSLPDSFNEYLDTESSPWNPNSKGYIYGLWPLTIVKTVASGMGVDNYGAAHITARSLSAIFDVGTLILVYFIAKDIFGNKTALWSAFMYSIMVFSIQQSHFFTVDNFLVFFLVLTFKFLVDFEKYKSKYSLLFLSLSGIAYGMALGSKVSALYFGVVIALIFGKKYLKSLNKGNWIIRSATFAGYSIVFLIFGYITFRLVNPYFFTTSNLLDISIHPDLKRGLDFYYSVSNGEVLFPPAWQWLNKASVTFSLKNLFLWGVGIGTSILALVGTWDVLLKVGIKVEKRQWKNLLSYKVVVLIWVLVLFFVISTSFIKSLRYMLPILPFMAILAGIGLSNTHLNKYKKVVIGVKHVFVVVSVLWTFAFINIYSTHTTRVKASMWIFANVNEGEIIANEAWDDPIPLRLTNDEYLDAGVEYKDIHKDAIMMSVYDGDDDAKIDKMYDELSRASYLFVTSDRARGTIGELSEKYPYMVQYYKSLDTGELGYKLVNNTTNYPKLFGIEINDSSAEEVFWIYDHPGVRIYKNVGLVSKEEFINILKDDEIK